FQISSNLLDKKVESVSYFKEEVVFASALMHETGHTFDFWPIPGHNKFSANPLGFGWWLTRLYKSCMNYGYVYRMVDYSDGSRPFLGPFFGDYDDWERMDFSYFLKEW
ncbi:MAG: hypothetical protein V5A68_03645, partial [Candidatus Thermoplasmatota archaeon]